MVLYGEVAIKSLVSLPKSLCGTTVGSPWVSLALLGQLAPAAAAHVGELSSIALRLALAFAKRGLPPLEQDSLG